jgi:hypothetical protein
MACGRGRVDVLYVHERSVGCQDVACLKASPVLLGVYEFPVQEDAATGFGGEDVVVLFFALTSWANWNPTKCTLAGHVILVTWCSLILRLPIPFGTSRAFR